MGRPGHAAHRPAPPSTGLGRRPFIFRRSATHPRASTITILLDYHHSPVHWDSPRQGQFPCGQTTGGAVQGLLRFITGLQTPSAMHWPPSLAPHCWFLVGL